MQILYQLLCCIYCPIYLHADFVWIVIYIVNSKTLFRELLKFSRISDQLAVQGLDDWIALVYEAVDSADLSLYY